ncbi:hypothetical protein HanPSC8_Chr14g0622251 [Helianthus annuus]|nr:hypothetical protein HanPSC8_Chr14g0622251 [Helianthus annuus]
MLLRSLVKNLMSEYNIYYHPFGCFRHHTRCIPRYQYEYNLAIHDG